MTLPAKVLFLQVGRTRHEVASLQQASEMFCATRDASGLGASQTPSPLVVDENGRVVGHVSYNGRVWGGAPREWTDKTPLLYDNGTGLRKAS